MPESTSTLRKRKWREANRERDRANYRAWVAANPERNKANSKAWSAANAERKRATAAAWYAANRDRLRAANKAWHLAHPGANRDRAKAWRDAHPEKARGHMVVRRQRMAKVYLEPIVRGVVYERDGGICQICGLPIGDAKWHVDHVIPIVLGGEHSYNNVQLAHARCNQVKGPRVA